MTEYGHSKVRWHFANALSIILFAGVLVGLPKVSLAATTTVSGYKWTYTTSGSTATITGCTPKPKGDFSLPVKIGSYTVTKLGDNVFADSVNLTRISLSNQVTTVLNSFQNCTKLTNLFFAANSISFGELAFTNCTSFTCFETSSPNYSVQDGVLYNADKTSLVRCPTGLEEISIPSTVTNILKFSFAHTIVSAVHLPDSLLSFSVSAFRCAQGLNTLTISDANPVYKSIDGILYNKDATELVLCPNKRTVVSVSNGVTNIANYAWGALNKLERITFPRTLERVNKYAFENFSSLKEMTFNCDVPENFAGAFDGIVNRSKVKVCYPGAYSSNWEKVLKENKFTNTEVISKGFILFMK